ncbi:MAG: hypothetical protein MR413_02710 [Clostridia bacterium]|nr:hypothetical protein [Clostridia bacterium]
MKKKITAILTTAATVTSILFSAVPDTGSASASARQMEYLDRGLVAADTGNGVYLSWRLLGSESLSNQAFDIYRNGSKIYTTGAADATCYTDTEGKETNQYIVVPKGESISNETAVTPLSSSHYTNYGSGTYPRNQTSYMDIPIIQPAGGTSKTVDSTDTKTADINYTYSANDASVGDLDGDGTYEIVLKWDPSNSEDSGKWDGNYTGNVYLDGYEISSDNTNYMWRIDLGVNIRAGAHYTQFIVYDLDGDGRAEIACKTAPGSKDGKGNYVTAAGDTETIRNADNSIDYRTAANGGSYGRIFTGPEYLTIFDGETGEALYTTDYISRGSVSDWGDGGANRSERYLASVAYLNGTTPSLIMTRGYYAKACAAAYNWDGTTLTRVWLNESTEESSYSVTDSNGNKTSYSAKSLFAQGNHNLTTSDVDNDGKDEIVFGSAVIDNDGTVLNSTGHGHGDALHVSDFNNDGEQEIFQVHEEGTYYVDYGAELRKGKNAEILQAQGTASDNGRGVMDNFLDYSETGKSSQFWSSGVTGAYNFDGSSAGDKPDFTNFMIYWDADLGREAMDSNKLGKYTSSGLQRFVWGNSSTYFPGASANNSTKANPCLSADIFGDWREEVIFKTGDDNLRLYMSCIPTTYRLTTLMHDSQYRCAVAWQNVGYNQPPHTSYYIGSAALASEDSTYLAPAVAFTEVTYPDSAEGTPKPTVLPTATPNVKTVTPQADTYLVYNDTAAAHGSDTELKINQAQNVYENATPGLKEAKGLGLIRFNLSEYTDMELESAVLHLYDRYTNTDKATSKLYLDYCSQDDWDEATVTANDITIRGAGTPLSSLGLNQTPAYSTSYSEITFDVTDAIKADSDNVHTFTLWTFTAREQVIASKEYTGTDAKGPELVLTYKSAEPTATPTVSPTAAPTVKPTATPTVAPTATPTAAPTATPTVAPTATPTVAPTATPTVAPTATPTVAPTATPTVAPTATPTVAPTATPTVAPTATPTVSPTATPAVAPMATPTALPTATPAVAPTATPTALPTATPAANPTDTPITDKVLEPIGVYKNRLTSITQTTADNGEFTISVMPLSQDNPNYIAIDDAKLIIAEYNNNTLVSVKLINGTINSAKALIFSEITTPASGEYKIMLWDCGNGYAPIINTITNEVTE